MLLHCNTNSFGLACSAFHFLEIQPFEQNFMDILVVYGTGLITTLTWVLPWLDEIETIAYLDWQNPSISEPGG